MKNWPPGSGRDGSQAWGNQTKRDCLCYETVMGARQVCEVKATANIFDNNNNNNNNNARERGLMELAGGTYVTTLVLGFFF